MQTRHAALRHLQALCRRDTPTSNEVMAFVRREMGGAFTWDEVARYRDRWKGPLVLKGILHPDDAESAIALGVDGIVVSNHGGRQVEALPASIDVLPAIVARSAARATVMIDSGVRSGARRGARAGARGAGGVRRQGASCGASARSASDGPGHVIDLLIEETQAALGQIGARTPAEARSVVVRHPGACDFSRNSL